MARPMLVSARGPLAVRLLAAACLLAAAAPHRAPALDVADGAMPPDFALKSLAGDNQRLSEQRGHVVLLNFWASWCGRCRAQLPLIDRLAAELGPQGLRVLTVSLDATPEDARELAAGLDLQIPVLLDPGRRVARAYDPGRMPLTVLLDPAGGVRAVHEGFGSDDFAALRADVERLLDEWMNDPARGSADETI